MDKLRIQLITKPKALFSFDKRTYNLIPFVYGVKVTNISEDLFEGGEMYNIEILWPQLLEQLTHEPPKNIKNIAKLKPKEYQEIWIEPKKMNTPGEYWLRFKLRTEKNIDIVTYQYDDLVKVDFNEHINEWGDILFLEDYILHEQLMTNIFLIILTSIMAFLSLISVACTLKTLNAPQYFINGKQILGR